MTRRYVLATLAFGLLIAAIACPDAPLLPTSPSPIGAIVVEEPGRIAISSAREGVIVGAGDIANCDTKGAEQTAKLLDAIPGTVVTAGDNAYFFGSKLDYERCFDPTWGRHRARTRPSPGNHEYETAGGAAYFDYFGENAGPPGLGYYAFSSAGWLILSLNSNVDASEYSAQMFWLRQTLRANPTRCTMAVFHHPPTASGQHGGSAVMLDMWRTLVEANVDVAMTGHEHLYERFAPLDAFLQPSSRGIRLFIAGTGGTHMSPLMSRSAGSEVRGTAWGVLRFTLRPDSYDWAFIPVPGAAFQDSGRDLCH
jgi:hypothetical protein